MLQRAYTFHQKSLKRPRYKLNNSKRSSWSHRAWPKPFWPSRHRQISHKSHKKDSNCSSRPPDRFVIPNRNSPYLGFYPVQTQLFRPLTYIFSLPQKVLHSTLYPLFRIRPTWAYSGNVDSILRCFSRVRQKRNCWVLGNAGGCCQEWGLWWGCVSGIGGGVGASWAHNRPPNRHLPLHFLPQIPPNLLLPSFH